MPKGNKISGAARQVISKKTKAMGSYRSAKSGRYVTPGYGKMPKVVEVKLRGLGKVLTLENRGEGIFEVIEPVVPPRTRSYGTLAPKSQTGKATPPTQQPQKVEPLYAHFYLGDTDALQAMTTTKALIDYLADLGYGEVKILEAEQGSLWARFKAWWNSEGGEQAREVSKQKSGEAYQYAEQWAKDAFVNKQMAEVTASNASSIAALIESVADQDDAILHVGNLLVIKQNGKVMAKQLSVPEMYALQTHSGILKDPAKAIETLALVVAGGGMPAVSEIEP